MAGKNKAQTEYSVAINTLKLILKERKITYKELAEGLNLSESGIKKILSGKDGSFQRLVQICQFIGISLNELIEDNRSVDVHFTEKEQSAFLKEPILFQIYWLLVYERRSMDLIRKDLQLSKTEAFRWVRKLDVLNLIKLLPNERIHLPSVKAIRWTGDGEFMRKIYQDWALNFIRDVAKPKLENDEYFAIRYLQMSAKTYAEFIAAQNTLEEEFVRRSIQEMRLQSKELKHVRWLMAADTRSYVRG